MSHTNLVVDWQMVAVAAQIPLNLSGKRLPRSNMNLVRKLQVSACAAAQKSDQILYRFHM